MRTRIGLVVISLILSLLIGGLITREAGEGVQKGSSLTQAGDSSDRPLTIGLSMDTLKEERWQTDRDLFVEKAKALGAEVIVHSANSNDALQIQQVQALLTQEVDVMVIIPHDGQAMARSVELCQKAGTPVISYDRLITNSDVDLYVTFDNVKVGELQAQYVVDQLKRSHSPSNPLKIVRIYGSKTDNNAKLFKEGQDNILNPYIESKRIVVLEEQWADDWKPENAKRITNAAIVKHKDEIEGVLASNDGTAGGAIQSLKENGMAGNVFVTGQDADLAACQRIVRGTQSMTIYKPIANLATRTAELSVKLASGKPVIARSGVNNGKIEVPSVLLEVVVVTKENLRETVVADGFRKEEDVYRSE